MAEQFKQEGIKPLPEMGTPVRIVASGALLADSKEMLSKLPVRIKTIKMAGGNVDMEGGYVNNVNYVSGNSGGIDFDEPGRIQISTHFDPPDAGSMNMGGSARYWGYINCYAISKQGGGGFGVFDSGVTLQDGTIVSDLEALTQMRADPIKKTPYGKPIYDMATVPAEVLIKPKDTFGNLIPKDKDGKYIEIDYKGNEVVHTEGEDVFAMISILLGAVKELNIKVLTLQGEVDKLK